MTPLEQIHARRLVALVENQVTAALGQFLLNPPCPVEGGRAIAESFITEYFKRLEETGVLKANGSRVQCGTATSTVLLRDRQNKRSYRQVHHAAVHYTNGVEPRSIKVRGKWRKAKVQLRKWLRDSLGSVAADTLLQPVYPVKHVEITYTVVPTENPDDTLKAG